MSSRQTSFLACTLLLWAVSACTSNSASGRAIAKTSSSMDEAIMSPFQDLNLTRVPIPPRLDAIRSPYEPVGILTCPSIAAEVNELTFILGPDSDAHLVDPTAYEKALESASNFTLGSVSSTMSGFLPYRSLLRRASGATDHEKKLRSAYARGVERRAYLKGIGAAMGCAPPAAPHPDAGLKPSPEDDR